MKEHKLKTCTKIVLTMNTCFIEKSARVHQEKYLARSDHAQKTKIREYIQVKLPRSLKAIRELYIFEIR